MQTRHMGSQGSIQQPVGWVMITFRVHAAQVDQACTSHHNSKCMSWWSVNRSLSHCNLLRERWEDTTSLFSLKELINTVHTLGHISQAVEIPHRLICLVLCLQTRHCRVIFHLPFSCLHPRVPPNSSSTSETLFSSIWQLTLFLALVVAVFVSCLSWSSLYNAKSSI